MTPFNIRIRIFNIATKVMEEGCKQQSSPARQRSGRKIALTVGRESASRMIGARSQQLSIGFLRSSRASHGYPQKNSEEKL